MKDFFSSIVTSLAFKATLLLIIAQTIPVIIITVISISNINRNTYDIESFGLVQAESLLREREGIFFSYPDDDFSEELYLKSNSFIEIDTSWQDQIIKHVKDNNPNFWYVIKSPNHDISYGPSSSQLDRKLRERQLFLIEGSKLCLSQRGTFMKDNQTGTFFFKECPNGETLYLEFGGLDDDYRVIDTFYADFPTHNRNFYLGIQYLALLVIFLATPLVIFFYTYPLRSASKVAEKIDGTDSGRLLPTKGVFAEVKGLIEAVNSALMRLRAVHQRERNFRNTIAHEIRTPLTLLRTRLDEIQSPELKKSMKQDLKGLLKLLDRVLLFANTSATLSKKETFDLAELTREACANCGRLALDSGVDIDFQEPEMKAMLCYSNRTALFLILVNILNNAIQHSQTRKGIQVILSDDYSITIKDFGIGMKKEQLDILNRVVTSKTDYGRRGIEGIGLTIISELARDISLKMKAENTPHEGTLVTLLIENKLPS